MSLFCNLTWLECACVHWTLCLETLWCQAVVSEADTRNAHPHWFPSTPVWYKSLQKYHWMPDMDIVKDTCGWVLSRTTPNDIEIMLADALSCPIWIKDKHSSSPSFVPALTSNSPFALAHTLSLFYLVPLLLPLVNPGYYQVLCNYNNSYIV